MTVNNITIQAQIDAVVKQALPIKINGAAARG
jgi:hypothetical protein